MSRWIVAVLMALAATTGPAAAQSDVIGQYQAAQQLFVGEAGSASDYLTKYPKKIFDGIAGIWVDVGVLQPSAGGLDVVRQACAKVGMHVRRQDDYTILAVRGEGTERQVDTSYRSLGGNLFSQSTDATQFLRFLGLDKTNPGNGMRENALLGTNGLATIARPSPDILVIQLNYRPPQILGRCPA
jgi:hypothetical protein